MRTTRHLFVLDVPVHKAQKYVQDILSIAIQHSDSNTAVVVFDQRCELATILTEAYRQCLPRAKFIDFDTVSPQEVLTALQALVPSDLVVLIQSTNFRLEAFRIRVELFNRSLKVIEHPHLSRMNGIEVTHYIDSLAYDPKYYRGVGNALKELIDRAHTAIVESGGERLVFNSGFEAAKLNVGDYSQMKNVGGQFPIGEVFTEAKDLESVNGRVRIFAFGDISFALNKPDTPITLVISKGKIVNIENTTPDFETVLASIRADEEVVWVRELGFGMNRALTQERTVNDIGTYERMCGVHLSLGAKHSIYKKPNFTRSLARHHVDVFAATETVTLDDRIIYQNGSFLFYNDASLTKDIYE